MLHIQVDSHSGIPIYRQVMVQVRYYAASGVLKPGALLPSIRDLARSLSVNPTTIVKAYNELQHDGVIEMRQGKGAFLSESAPPPSAEECQEALRRIAAQLAVEATQMGASREEVLKIVSDELEHLRASARMPHSVQEVGKGG